MESIQEHINRIYNKLQQKLKHLAALEKENAQQQKEMATLRQQKEDLELQVKSLQEQNYILKAATNTMSAADKTALEQSINKYIRDIDKCIGLLRE